MVIQDSIWSILDNDSLDLSMIDWWSTQRRQLNDWNEKSFKVKRNDNESLLIDSFQRWIRLINWID